MGRLDISEHYLRYMVCSEDPYSDWICNKVTVKTHDTPPVSGAVFNFDVPAMSQDTYWAAVEAFHSFAPSFADAGIFGYYELNKQLWFIKPLIAPHKTLSELAAIMAPMMAKFDELGVKYTSNITTHSTFLEGYEALFDPEGAGANMFTSSRLFLREHVEGNNSAITAAFRNGAEQGYHFIGHVVAPGQFGGVSKETSVNPIWKKGLLLPLYNYMWNGTETQEQKWAVIQNLIDNVDTEFKDASPGSGTYINEVCSAIPCPLIVHSMLTDCERRTCMNRTGRTTFTVRRIRGC